MAISKFFRIFAPILSPGAIRIGARLITKNNDMIKITFPDNSVKEFEAGSTPLQIAQSISPRLGREVLASSVNGEEWDLSRPIEGDATIKLFKWEDPEEQAHKR